MADEGGKNGNRLAGQFHLVADNHHAVQRKIGHAQQRYIQFTIIHLGPARAVVINLSYPVFAALLASLFLSKHLGFMKLTWILIGLAGASLTLLATFMVNRQTSKPLLKMPSKPTPIHDNH